MNSPFKHKYMKLALLLLLYPILNLIIQFTPTSDFPIADKSFTLAPKAKEAFDYCKKHNYDTDFCVLVDMRIHSGKNRMFIWDFKSDSILNSGLCSHGCGDNPWGADETKKTPIFSNTPDSHLSSLGKYKIGKRGYSQWGINVNYKLHGLDATNKNAYKRYIVLHSWEMVPNQVIYPEGTPEGWGCPAVSNDMMKTLDKRLKTTSKPVLLWVFN